MTDRERFEELAFKWLRGTITEKEKAAFSKWCHQDLDKPLPIPETFASGEEEIRERILAQIKVSMKSPLTKRKKRSARLQWVAAIAIFLLVSGWLAYYMPFSQNEQARTEKMLGAIKSIGNKATLVLGSGESLDLSDKQPGIVVGDEIRYADGSKVVDKGKLPLQLQLKTPRGGTYHITLADGTKVWLNAASSLTYPLYFKGKERVVELTGEAYFEVTSYRPNNGAPVMPFRVLTQGQRVEVLGTQFVVNAYEDEADVKTTLVDGAVRVSEEVAAGSTAKGETVLLKPGNQAVLTPVGLKVQQVQTELFTAWKEGYFDFEDANIYTVMKQLARWYDIDVQYQGVSTDDLFVGRIPRKANLSTALKVLKTAGVKVELVGDRKLLVTSKKKM